MIRPYHIVFDCSDVSRTAAFWATLLDVKIASSSDSWAELEPVVGLPVLAFQAVPEGKPAKNRMHIDFSVENLDAARERVTDLGGSVVGPVQGSESRWQVFGDVEGNEFCLCQ